MPTVKLVQTVLAKLAESESSLVSKQISEDRERALKAGCHPGSTAQADTLSARTALEFAAAWSGHPPDCQSPGYLMLNELRTQ